MLNSLVIVLGLLFTLECTESTTIKYKIEKNYTKYIEKFQEDAGEQNTIDMTEHATGKELCEEKPCKFYIFKHEPKQYKGTILIISGFHGNENIGPTACLYSYNELKQKTRHRLIFFPIGNPSGYLLNERETYPNKIDTNRDYPIDNNTKCYESSATRIIDHIFRTYDIDLTVAFHNGGNEIGWNWGTNTHKKDSHTDDYDIYEDVGEMLQFYGGYNNHRLFQMKKLKIGTMNEVVYPATGTLDDWAYAGSWDQSVPAKCDHFVYDSYPANMHHGLVFLFQLGKFDVTDEVMGTSDGLFSLPGSSISANGFASRTIRMLEQLMFFADPSFMVKFGERNFTIKIVGCKSIAFHQVQLFYQDQILFEETDLQLQKVNTLSFTNFITIQLPEEKNIPDNLQVSYNFSCDESWRGKGHTIFAKERNFEGKEVYLTAEEKVTDQFLRDAGSLFRKLSKRSYFFLYLGAFMIGMVIFSVVRRKGSNISKEDPYLLDQLKTREKTQQAIISDNKS